MCRQRSGRALDYRNNNNNTIITNNSNSINNNQLIIDLMRTVRIMRPLRIRAQSAIIADWRQHRQWKSRNLVGDSGRKWVNLQHCNCHAWRRAAALTLSIPDITAVTVLALSGPFIVISPCNTFDLDRQWVYTSFAIAWLLLSLSYQLIIKVKI